MVKRRKRVKATCECLESGHKFKRVPREGIQCTKCGSYDMFVDAPFNEMFIPFRGYIRIYNVEYVE